MDKSPHQLFHWTFILINTIIATIIIIDECIFFYTPLITIIKKKKFLFNPLSIEFRVHCRAFPSQFFDDDDDEHMVTVFSPFFESIYIE